MSKPIIEPLRLGSPKRATLIRQEAEKTPDDLPSLLYELMIGEAQEKFYINDAPKPAWLILGKYCLLTETKSSYELWFSTIHRWKLRTLKECHSKIEEMVTKAKVPMKVWIENHRGKRKLFAEKEEVKL